MRKEFVATGLLLLLVRPNPLTIMTQVRVKDITQQVRLHVFLRIEKV